MICINSKKIEKTCWQFKELVIAYLHNTTMYISNINIHNV
jgi:hypothetical protein